MTQPTLINLHPNEYIEGFAFVFPFVFNLDRCMGSCNTLNKCWCECINPKEHNACEKYYTWNPSTYCCVKMLNI